MNSRNNSSEGCIKLIQHNANRQEAAHHSVLQQGLENAADIILLQEPYCPKVEGVYIGLQHSAYNLVIPIDNTALSAIPARPRVLVYIRKASNLEYTPRYDLFNDLDMQAIEVIGLETFLIYNIYNEKERDGPNLSPSQNRLRQRRRYTTIERLLLHTQIQEPTILVGDFNLHHPLWNCTATPAKAAKAAKLVNWLDNQGAVLAIDPEEVSEKGGTYNRKGLKAISIIDLAFYSSFKKLAWSNWHFLDNSGSDHEVITLTAKPISPFTNNMLHNTRPPLFNYKLANWEKYSKLIRQKEATTTQQIDYCIATRDCDGVATAITKIMLESAEKAIPRLKPCERSKPWWTTELTKLRKALNRVYRLYKKHRSSYLEEEYKKAKNTYFNSIREAKRTCWNNFLQNAIKEDIFKAYKYTKPCQNTAIPSIRYTKEGKEEIAKTFNQKCEAFLSTIFPSQANLPTIPQSQSPNSPGLNGLSSKDSRRKSRRKKKEKKKSYKWEWPDLEDKEIKEAIFSFKKTAPGPDTIGSVLIQKTYQIAPNILNKAYKALFTEGYHPASWRSSIGTILPKPGKDKDSSDPGSYRIIALLNNLGKILEKLYATRLSYLANTTDLLHNSQLGGRKQRSAIDAALLLTQFIEEQRLSRKSANNTITTTIFLDIKGGFDRISKEKLLKVLERLQLPKSLISWVASFLENRNTQLAFSNQMQQQPSNLLVGTPQGSPISPILFLLYIRDIIADKAFQLSYMDDFSLSISSTSAHKNCKALERIVAKLVEEAKKRGVTFNPKKTELIHFTTQREPITVGLTVAGQAISPKKLVRWLGIWFDPKLSFKQHIEKRIDLATAAFLGLQRLSNTQKGLSFRAVRQLYSACVTTIADYGVPVWYKGLRQGKLIQLYQRLQSMALPKILGAFKGSPIRAMELEAAVLPPEVRFQKACLGYSLRTLYLQHNHPIRIAYNKAIREDTNSGSGSGSDLSSDSDSDLGAITAIKPTTQLHRLLYNLKEIVGSNRNIERRRATWNTPWAKAPTATIAISSNKKDRAKKEHLDLLETLFFKDCNIFYTDGSQGNYRGQKTNACAYCKIDAVDSRKTAAKYWNLGPYIEVADAELIAISKVLELLQNSTNNPPETYIFIDSQAAILKVSSHSDIAINIQKQLVKLADKGIKITLSWCPSHIGIPGNELADQLAKKGLEANQEENPYTSLSYLRRRIKESCLEKWRDLWQAAEAKGAQGLGKHYRKVVRESLRFAYSPHFTTSTRAIHSAYIQLKLGVGFIKSYQKTLGNIASNKCRCGQVQTATHLILYCKRYREQRKTLQQALKVGQPLNLQILFSTKLGRKALIGFLASTRICTAKWYEEE